MSNFDHVAGWLRYRVSLRHEGLETSKFYCRNIDLIGCVSFTEKFRKFQLEISVQE